MKKTIYSLSHPLTVTSHVSDVARPIDVLMSCR